MRDEKQMERKKGTEGDKDEEENRVERAKRKAPLK